MFSRTVTVDDCETSILYCNSIGCPDGYTPIDNAKEVECEDDPCKVAQCCEAFCSYYACPNNCTPVTGAAGILCDDSGCTTELCCDCREFDPILPVLRKFLMIGHDHCSKVRPQCHP